MEVRMALIARMTKAAVALAGTRARAVGECVSASSYLDLYLGRLSPEFSCDIRE